MVHFKGGVSVRYTFAFVDPTNCFFSLNSLLLRFIMLGAYLWSSEFSSMKMKLG